MSPRSFRDALSSRVILFDGAPTSRPARSRRRDHGTGDEESGQSAGVSGTQPVSSRVAGGVPHHTRGTGVSSQQNPTSSSPPSQRWRSSQIESVSCDWPANEWYGVPHALLTPDRETILLYVTWGQAFGGERPELPIPGRLLDRYGGLAPGRMRWNPAGPRGAMIQ